MTVFRDISVLWSLIHILILFVFLYEPRYPRKKTLILTCIFMIPLIILNVWGLMKFGAEFMGQVLILTCTVPSLIFFWIMAKNRKGKFFFTFCLVDTLSLEIIIITNIIDFYLPGEYIFMFVSRLVAFPLLEVFLYKCFRKKYINIQNKVNKGWGVFAAVSALYYLLLVVMSSFPTIITSRGEYIPALVIVLFLMPFMYLTIFNILKCQMDIHDMENREQSFEFQAAMLKQHISQIEKNEEQNRIYRHDMRHRLKTISVLIQKNELSEALNYINETETEFGEKINVRYCKNAILDAVLTYYFQKAKEADIHTDINISIPEELSVNDIDLATVFANSIENAINACKKLTKEQRIIRCKCISEPQLMFQISNPYVGTVKFDGHSHPVATEEGHGTGTRSILAFCEKYNVYCEYKAEDGWFTFRLYTVYN